MIALPGDGNAAASAGDDKISGIHHCADRSDLNDFLRLRGSYDAAVAPAGVFSHYIVIFCGHYISFFFCEETADRFGRRLKRGVVRVHTHLGDHCCHGDIFDSAVQQLFTERVLQVVSDICLAHCNADGEGGVWLPGILMGQRDHGVINHAYLRAVSVGYDHFTPFLDQINDSF